MNKSLKSLANSLIIILLYYISLIGLVRAFWHTSDEYQFEGRVKFLGLLLILLTIIGVVVPYHLFNYSTVDFIYRVIGVGHLLLLGVGITSYTLIKK